MFYKNFKIKKYLDKKFQITLRNSSFQREIIAGCTTFLSMIYSVIIIPNILQKAGFSLVSVFISTCLIASFGSIFMGIWVNLPIIIGSSISLTSFITFNLILNKNISIVTILYTVSIMGIFFTIISITNIRIWIISNFPIGISSGISIGMGLFLILIALNNIGFITKKLFLIKIPTINNNIHYVPIFLSILGLIIILILEKFRIYGSILFTTIFISIIGSIADPSIKYKGFFAFPDFYDIYKNIFLFNFDILEIFNPRTISNVFSFIIIAIFDATSTIFAVTNQLHLKNKIINSKKILIVDSITSIFSGIIGNPPAAVYIESATGISAGGKTGLTAIIVGLLFILILFISPLIYLIPLYATSPALIYVGLLMIKNIKKIFSYDFIDKISGILTGIFIAITSNIVIGIMLGLIFFIFSSLISRKFHKITVEILIIETVLFISCILEWLT